MLVFRILLHFFCIIASKYEMVFYILTINQVFKKEDFVNSFILNVMIELCLQDYKKLNLMELR